MPTELLCQEAVLLTCKAKGLTLLSSVQVTAVACNASLREHHTIRTSLLYLFGA